MNDKVESSNTPETLSGQDLHVKSEQLRESGNFLQAAIAAQGAERLYLEEDNPVKAAEACASEMLAWRHKFEREGDPEDRNHAREAIEKGVLIMKDSGEKVGLGTVLYNLAKFYQTEGNNELAIKNMKAALVAFEDAPDDPMGFPAHRAEIRTRLSAFEYGAGDDTAFDRFEIAVSDLKDSPHPDDYAQTVWLSGAYMHMAQAYIEKGEKEKALEFLVKADILVRHDERFKLRQNQIVEARAKI